MYLSLIILPFLSFILCSFFGRRVGDNGTRIISSFLVLISLFLSLVVFYDVSETENFSYVYLWSWFKTGMLECQLSLSFDLIACSTLVLVLSVSFLVHLFSTSYMNHDPHLPRFMSYLSLFTFFMVVLITSSNLVQLFIGWEGVGLCSYLLINFWFTRLQANKASIKAMVVNKVGDVSLLLAMAIIWKCFGSWSYNSIFPYTVTMQENNVLSFCGLLLFVGVIGKSAQIGLHIWLPDAMEGPTPVSALIHAATMVTAGVFLIIRLSPFFETISSVSVVIITIGSLTAFFSSTIGIFQNDFKRIIAYSTCSQLGYMVLICGFSQYGLGLFHLINHGFFKALLFLSAGSIIHATLDEQDIRKGGSILYFIPLTYTCVLVGSLSLMGLPFLSGFYSKDLIIETISGSYYLSFSLLLATISASLTAFYSFRLVYFTFFAIPQLQVSPFRQAYEGNWGLIFPLLVLAVLSLSCGYCLQLHILGDQMPAVVPNFTKSLTLVISMVGVIAAIGLGYSITKMWSTVKLKVFHLVYTFVNIAWYFDRVIGYYLVGPTIRVGFDISYKLIDNQLLEKFGPTWISTYLTTKASSLSRYHRGFIHSYIYLFLLFISCFII